MHIEQIPIVNLKPAPYNPRVSLQPGMPAYERLSRSLAEFDLVQPIVWNRRTGHVVGGHQRLEILRREGVLRIPCVVVDLTLEREQALNIALNNEKLCGAWDEPKLLALLTELTELSEFDATLTGFDDADLKDLLLAPAVGLKESSLPTTDDDETAAPSVHIALDLPMTDWEMIRPEVDDLLRLFPTIRAHVRLPTGK